LIVPGNAPCPIDFDGKFTEQIHDYKGVYIKTADDLIKNRLKEEKRLVCQNKEVHSYPFCWRS
jgi:isoleucyl-tRNA synthetase